jgi:hypothetical protein
MALKADEEDPKPPVNDPGGSVSQGGRSGERFGPQWVSGVVVAHQWQQDLVVVTGPLRGGGGGGGHMIDPTSGDSGLTSLAPSLGARVLVGRPHGPIWICAVYLYDDLGGVDSVPG